MARQVVCRARFEEPGRVLEFTWSVASSAFPPYAQRDDIVEKFRDNSKAARDRRLFTVTDLFTVDRLVR